MAQLISVETSIPSFYFETRPAAQMQAPRDWTREWWDMATLCDDLNTSLGVIHELNHTPEPKGSECLPLLESLAFLDITEEADDLVETYIANKVMPADAAGVAAHFLG
jgi:hypothetical protein